MVLKKGKRRHVEYIPVKSSSQTKKCVMSECQQRLELEGQAWIPVGDPDPILIDWDANSPVITCDGIGKA